MPPWPSPQVTENTSVPALARLPAGLIVTTACPGALAVAVLNLGLPTGAGLRLTCAGMSAKPEDADGLKATDSWRLSPALLSLAVTVIGPGEGCPSAQPVCIRRRPRSCR